MSHVIFYKKFNDEQTLKKVSNDKGGRNITISIIIIIIFIHTHTHAHTGVTIIVFVDIHGSRDMTFADHGSRDMTCTVFN